MTITRRAIFAALMLMVVVAETPYVLGEEGDTECHNNTGYTTKGECESDYGKTATPVSWEDVPKGCAYTAMLLWNTYEGVQDQTWGKPVCRSPTPAPTSPPTDGGDSGGASGDPHVTTLAGEKYDILNSGSYTALVIPRGAMEELYQIQLAVVQKGKECVGSLFTEAVMMRGSLLGKDKQMTVHANTKFTMNMNGGFEDWTAGKVWTIAHNKVPPVGWPANGQAFDATLQAGRSSAGRRSYTLSLAGVRTHVEAVGKRGFHFLNIAITGVSKVKHPIGGFLGLDDQIGKAKDLCQKKRKIKLISKHSLVPGEAESAQAQVITIS